MPGLAKYINGVLMFALLMFSVAVLLPSLISAKDSASVTLGFVYAAALIPVLYFWARKVFFLKS